MNVATVAYLFMLNIVSTTTAATVQNLVVSLKTWINQQLEDYKIPCWINFRSQNAKNGSNARSNAVATTIDLKSTALPKAATYICTLLFISAPATVQG